MKSYLFSCGNSNTGPIGFCLRVKASSPQAALNKVRKVLPECIERLENHCDSDDIEYMNVYINPDAVTLANIEEEETI